MNGQSSSTRLASVDYSRMLHEGASREALENLLTEYDRTRQDEIAGLRRQVTELSSALQAARSRSPGGVDGSDIQGELTRIREEFATSLASLRALVTEGDGDLHEMQLTSLRRQVAQLEGVLESNYQRELRVAEERETALRAEMAQMRQDLRVALETLYRMPSDGDAGSVDREALAHLEKQVADLGSRLDGSSREQQQAAADREAALRADIAQMRRDLLVTLEASYQIPSCRTDAVDAHITAWRGQVAELQHLILTAQEAQEHRDEAQRTLVREDLAQLRLEVQETIERVMGAPDEPGLAALRDSIDSLGRRIEGEARRDVERIESLEAALRDHVAGVQTELASLRAEFAEGRQALAAFSARAAGGDGAARVEAFAEEMAALRAAVEAGLASESRALEERFSDFAGELQGIRGEIASSTEDLRRPEEAQALAVLRGQVTSLAEQLETVSQSQRDLAEAHAAALREELGTLTESWGAELSRLLEAERLAGGPAVDDVGAEVSRRLAALQAGLSAAGTEQYRQIASQIAHMQTDMDELRTAMQGLEAVQPVPEAEAAWNDRVQALLVALEARAAVTDAGPAVQGDEIRDEIAGLREEIRALAHARPVVLDEGAASALTPEDVAQALGARLEREWAERKQVAEERENSLRLELAEMRDALHAALARPGEETEGAASFTLEEVASAVSAHLERAAEEREDSLRRELAESTSSVADSRAVEVLRADLASVRDLLQTAAADPTQSLRDEIGGLRAELAAMKDSILSSVSPARADEDTHALAERVHEMEAELAANSAQQERSSQENAALLTAVAELRRDLQAVVATLESGRKPEDTETVESGLDELRLHLVAIAGQVQAAASAPGIEPLARELAGLRAEMQAALAIQTEARRDPAADAREHAFRGALAEMRDEIRTALNGLTPESVDAFEKRQTQLHIDQLEMERNLAKLREELLATQVETGAKKKLWR